MKLSLQQVKSYNDNESPNVSSRLIEFWNSPRGNNSSNNIQTMNSPRTSSINSPRGNTEEHVPDQFAPCRIKIKRSIVDITPEWIGDLAPNRATFRRIKHVFPRLPSMTMSPMIQSSPLVELLQSTSRLQLRKKKNLWIQGMENTWEEVQTEGLNTDSCATEAEIEANSNRDEFEGDEAEEEYDDDEEEEENDEDGDEDDTPIIHESVSALTKAEFDELSTCNTIKEQLFQLCSLSDDRGWQVMSKIIENEKRTTRNIASLINGGYGPREVTLMHAAARANNYQCMQILYNYGADLNALDSIRATPLHYACANNSKEAVCFLLLNKADPNVQDLYQTYPLLIAMRNNCLEVIKMLTLCRADIHLKGVKGDTCLHVAAREGYLKRVKFLVEECSASVSRLNREHENVLFSAISNYSIVFYICDHVGKYGSFQILCKLVRVMSRLGKTVFHEAVAGGYLKSLLVIIQALIKFGTRVNNSSTTTNDEFSESQDIVSPIDNGFDQKNLKAVQEFIAQRLNEFDLETGLAPIHTAVIKGHSKIVKYLSLCSEVNIDIKDKKLGNTAMHYAIENKNQEIIDILLNIGNANIKKRNKSKKSCKILAEQLGVQLGSTNSPSSYNMQHSQFSFKAIRRTTADRLFRSHS